MNAARKGLSDGSSSVVTIYVVPQIIGPRAVLASSNFIDRTDPVIYLDVEIQYTLGILYLDVKINMRWGIYMREQTDAVDEILGQWKKECPELQTDAMGTIGRLKRCSSLLQPKLEAVFTQYSLTSWEFDVLATLRRSGEPYCLAPTPLLSALMISSGTMTNRMNRLEERGLVKRKPDPQDARSKLVQLTPKGLELVSSSVLKHVENEEYIMSVMSNNERNQLDKLLKKFMASLESILPKS